MSVPKPKIVFGRFTHSGTIAEKSLGQQYKVLKIRSWSGYMPGDLVSRKDIEELLDSEPVRAGRLEVEVLGHWEDTPREVRR